MVEKEYTKQIDFEIILQDLNLNPDSATYYLFFYLLQTL